MRLFLNAQILAISQAAIRLFKFGLVKHLRLQPRQSLPDTARSRTNIYFLAFQNRLIWEKKNPRKRENENTNFQSKNILVILWQTNKKNTFK